MKQITVIKTKMIIEFKDGKFEKWDERPIILFGFENEEEANEELFAMRQEEVENYKNWHKEMRGCFIHHYYELDKMIVF